MKNYIYKKEGSGYYATRFKPSFSASEYNGFGHYYDSKTLKWYSDVSIFADDFSTDTSSNYTAIEIVNNTTLPTLSVVEGNLIVTNNATASYGAALKTLTGLTVGKKYLLVANIGTDVYVRFQDSYSYTPNYAELNSSGSIVFTAHSASVDLVLGAKSNTALKKYSFNYVSVIPLNDDGSIDISNATEVTTAQSYLPLTVEVDTQGNVLDYDKFDVPTLVEEYIVADKVKAEFSGKNACTAWVNFDGSTTPPTIRDSYNVSQVIRTGTGIYEVYFKESMENTNYTVNISNGYNAVNNNFGNVVEVLDFNKFKFKHWENNIAYNISSFLIQIFGGKD